MSLLLLGESRFLCLGGMLLRDGEVPRRVRNEDFTSNVLAPEGTTVINLGDAFAKVGRLSLLICHDGFHGPVPHGVSLASGDGAYSFQDSGGTFGISLMDAGFAPVLVGVSHKIPTSYQWRLFGQGNLADTLALSVESTTPPRE